MAAALVLVLAVTAAVITDDPRTARRAGDTLTPQEGAIVEAATNGLVAYSYAGDIYVGLA